ncbi:zinc knuckle-domain-containing protein [Xylariomycetidae sp. FL0641]|nr:zinc knuckle-domain-containing protein [Xylariomycetidae sp. FL0641]
MYRRGPSKSTPANVQCQKCLKRGHYSYECKGSVQERPYIARPSRTQQLLNPKLVPKLSSDVPDALQKSKGVADQELAKREAERARKRQLEREDEELEDDAPKRRRSASYDSVSTISTTKSASPPKAKGYSRSPPPPAGRSYRSPSPAGHVPRKSSYDDSASEHDRRYSLSPPRGGAARDDSPVGRSDYRETRSPSYAREQSPDGRSRYSRGGRYSRSPSRSPPREQQHRFRSRSPVQPRRRDRSPRRHNGDRAGRDRGRGRGRDMDREDRGRVSPPPPRQEARERSLSPFSKRLALTQAMNTSR